MIPLGFTTAETVAFARLLASDHTVVTRVQITDLDGDVVSNVSAQVEDGQVNLDADAEVTRSLNLTLSDPTRSLALDSPNDGSLYLDRMIAVEQSFRLDDERVDVPIFTGPVVKFDRDGDQVSVEGQGKELLALNECWSPITLKKGQRKVLAIQDLLGERTGETDFVMPALIKERLPETVSVGRLDKPWLVAKQIADSMNRQLYYDGAGRCRLRTPPERSTFTFTNHGLLPNITAPVQVSKDGSRMKNTIWVKGGRRLGKRKGNVSVVCRPARNHPLSPWSLGRNGVPRHYVEVVERDSIRTEADARRLGDRILRNRLLDIMDVTFEALPIPHMDPNDLIHVEFDGLAADIRLRKFSLPITVGGDMSVGSIRRVSVNRKRIRR